MSIQKLTETSDKILTRLNAVAGRGEEATKQALVLPMLEALGYDIWNPLEVCPEYEADFAVKKSGQKEKVDYAILLDGVARIYIEVKPYKTDLTNHQGQLARYFNSTTTVSLGIITNGVEYRLYTDTGDPNIMDSEPFHIVNLEHHEQGLETFAKFQKAVFSPSATRDFASELQYTSKMVNFFRTELDIRELEPSDSLVRWVMSGPGMFDGRLTSNALDRFRPIVKTALQKVLREIVRRSVAALDEELLSPAHPNTILAEGQLTMPTTATTLNQQSTLDVSVNTSGANEIEKEASKVVTTEAELECFSIIKKIFENHSVSRKLIIDPSTRKETPLEIGYKDTSYYFAVYLNKITWWIARIVIEGRKTWIGFDLDPTNARFITPPEYEVLEENSHSRFRVAINKPHDIEGLKELIVMACKQIVEKLKQPN